jgi:hypothetical protein
VVSSSKPSEGFGGFGLKTIKGRFGGLSLKTTVWMVSRVYPQNRGGTWWNHRDYVKAKQICAGSV